MTEIVEVAVLRKYEILQMLGKGAYGVVWKALDKRTRNPVALKKCYDAFRNSTDAQRTYREIMYLEELKGHENIVELLEVIEAENKKDIYLVFEFIDTDLYTIIRSHILEDIHRKYIIYQILKALKYIHSAGLIHRDIKPSNILVYPNCVIKLCDFGLCRSIIPDEECPTEKAIVTDYIATRWYRAPEILLGSTYYDYSVDIWAVGCLLAELLLEKPLFPGTSTMNQLERILTVTGFPSNEDILHTHSSYAKVMLEDLSNTVQVPLSHIFTTTGTAEVLDFITKCLVFNPDKRMTVENALRHPYLAEFHDVDDEITYPHPIKLKIPDYIKVEPEIYEKTLYKQLNQKREAQRMKNRKDLIF